MRMRRRGCVCILFLIPTGLTLLLFLFAGNSNILLNNVSDDVINSRVVTTGHKEISTRPPPILVTKKLRVSTKKTMVIILTYMRSGSSLTGDIIQQSPDVFYSYEPLHSLNHLRKCGVSLLYLRRRRRNSLNADPLDTIRNILTCDLFNLDLHALNQYHLFSSKSTWNYSVCVSRSNGIVNMLTCLDALVDVCRAADVVSIKSIRLQMEQMHSLMKTHPRLKIVHLVRDPRGTLLSQRKVSEFKWSELSRAARRLCKQISSDFQVAEYLRELHGNRRILTLRYEDLAEEPVETSKLLYEFLGLGFTKGIERYIINITQSGLPDGCVTCTTRNSSAATAYRWRAVLDYQSVVKIDKACREVYSQVGYLPIEKKKFLSDTSYAVREKHNGKNNGFKFTFTSTTATTTP